MSHTASQTGQQNPPRDPKGQSPDQSPPDSDPCADPKPCPPKERPCPPSKPCPRPPQCKDPDPCTEPPQPGPLEEPDGKDPPPPPPRGKGCDCHLPEAETPREQLEELQLQLRRERHQVEDLERRRASLTDLEERVQALQTTINDKGAQLDAYQEFYRQSEAQRNELDGLIGRLRCQLHMKPEKETCITNAIAKVDAKVQRAAADRDQQAAWVRWYEYDYAKKQRELAFAQKTYDLLKTGLQEQTQKRRDELDNLKTLADPKKDPCEVEFYLREMERILNSEHCRPDTDQNCYDPALELGTFLDCWAPDCWSCALDEAVVRLNDAEYAERIRKTELDAAKAALTDLEQKARDAKDKRRDWILTELKECCKPGGCP